jgi:hypothetical protein
VPNALTITLSEEWKRLGIFQEDSGRLTKHDEVQVYKIESGKVVSTNEFYEFEPISFDAANLSTTLDGFWLDIAAKNSPKYITNFWIRFTSETSEPRFGDQIEIREPKSS